MHRISRFFTTVKTVTVYEAPYYKDLASISQNFVNEAPKVLKDKYYSFIPFYLESRLGKVEKRFVVKMEIVPDESKLRFTSLQLGSLDVQEVPIESIVPVTTSDYEISHFGGKLIKSADFFDLDMIYLNKPDAEFYVFDKEGIWVEEGVNHPALSLSKTFEENKWYDTSCGPISNIAGGNKYVNP